jgi:hypothetical protein
VAIQQVLQALRAKAARCITGTGQQRRWQGRQRHAPAGLRRRDVCHAAVELLTTLNAGAHRRFPSMLIGRLLCLSEKDNQRRANIDCFACKISPVFISACRFV